MTVPPSPGEDLPAGSTIVADVEALAHAAAARTVAIVAATEGERIAICLSGGSTPRRLYELLAANVPAALPWGRIHWFFGDERMVPPDSPDSNARMARDALLSAAPIPADHVHAVPTVGVSVEEAARAYAAELAGFYGSETLDPARPLFDLTLLGIGEDGHTASLFPGKPAIEEDRAWAVPVPEAGLPPQVPRVTLTRPVLASSRHVLFLVAGATKRPVLTRIARGELPAARVAAASPDARWLIDRAAATGVSP